MCAHDPLDRCGLGPHTARPIDAVAPAPAPSPVSAGGGEREGAIDRGVLIGPAQGSSASLVGPSGPEEPAAAARTASFPSPGGLNRSH